MCLGLFAVGDLAPGAQPVGREGLLQAPGEHLAACAVLWHMQHGMCTLAELCICAGLESKLWESGMASLPQPCSCSVWACSLHTPSMCLCCTPAHSVQAAGSKRKRAAAEGSAAADAEESGHSGGLSEEGESSEEGTSGVKPKPLSAKKRANPRKPSNPMRAAIDEGSTGSDAKKVGRIG